MSLVVHRARMHVARGAFGRLPVSLSVVKVTVGWRVVRRVEGLSPADRFWRPSYRTAMRKYDSLIVAEADAGRTLDLTRSPEIGAKDGEPS